MPHTRLVLCFFLFFFGISSLCAQAMADQPIQSAEDNKNKEEGGYLASYLVNWNETLYHFSHCQENNGASSDKHFLLGECPSNRAIGAYYASTALIHYAAANLLPNKYSRALKDSSLNFQISLLKDQSSLGMTFNY